MEGKRRRQKRIAAVGYGEKVAKRGAGKDWGKLVCHISRL